jgi:hypothetical protein
MTPLTLRRRMLAVLAVAVGITGIAVGLARAGTPTPAASSDRAVPPAGQLQYQRLDAPARTIARAPAGEVVATMTDGARTVALLGPVRTFADPDFTAATVTTTAWVRLMPQEWSSGTERQPWFQPWLDHSLGDTSPDMFALAQQYLRGQPADTDRAGVTYRGDAGFGPEVTGAGTRQENSDFYDYLAVSWTFPNGRQEVAIQLLPLTSAARSAPPRARRRAARRRSSVGGRVPVLRAAAACALWLVGLV